MWNPPRCSRLSGVASQIGPKGGCHAKRKRRSSLPSRCWVGASFLRFRPYLWRTPADSGRVRPLHSDLRPWWKEWRLPAEYQAPKDVPSYPIRPTRPRADLGLNRKKRINPGDSKGLSLWWVFGDFLPIRKSPCGAKTGWQVYARELRKETNNMKNPGAAYCCSRNVTYWGLKLSFRDTARLNTRCSGLLSRLSAQK